MKNRTIPFICLDERGGIGLAASVFMIAILGTFGLVLSSIISSDSQRTSVQYFQTKAFYIAESGIRYAFAKSMNDAEEVDSTEAAGSTDRVVICHKPPGNPHNSKTMIVDRCGIRAHLDHGDCLGPKDIDNSDADKWDWSEQNIPIGDGFADVTVGRISSNSDTVVITSSGRYEGTGAKIERKLRLSDYGKYGLLVKGTQSRISVRDEDDQPASHRSKCVSSDDSHMPDMDVSRLQTRSCAQAHFFEGHLSVAANSVYPPGGTSFYSQMPSVVETPGELDESHLSFKYIAEGRIGNAANSGYSTHELNVSRTNTGHFDDDQTANFSWQSDVTVPFTLTYSASNRSVMWRVNNTTTAYWSCNINSSDLEKIYIRARSTTNSAITLDNFVLDGIQLNSILTSSAAEGTINVLQISGGTLGDGFTLTGNVKMTFQSSGSSRPSGSQLAFQIKVGKDNIPDPPSTIQEKEPHITWLNGDLTVGNNAKVYGIVVVNGNVTLGNNATVEGVIYRNKCGSSTGNAVLNNNSQVKGGCMGHMNVSGPQSGSAKICHKQEYVTAFYQYVHGYLPHKTEWLNWRQF